MFSTAYCRLGLYWRDAVIVITLAVMAGGASYRGAQLMDAALFDGRVGYDVWFESDIPRVLENMTGRPSDQSRTELHPLFILMTFPAVYLLSAEFGLGRVAAVQIAIATAAALWIGAFFILLRLIGCQRLDATLFSLLAMVSAAAVIWFTVPESYPFGSLSILLALCLVAAAQRRAVSPLWYVVVSAATFSVTLTNWMAGILATVVNHSWKRSLRITVAAFFLVVALGGVQRL
jgi:hypothetical protein